MQVIFALVFIWLSFKLIINTLIFLCRHIKVILAVHAFFIILALIIAPHMIVGYLAIAFFISVLLAAGLDTE